MQSSLSELLLQEQDEEIWFYNSFYKIANNVVVHFVWGCDLFIAMSFNNLCQVEKNVVVNIVENLTVSFAVRIHTIEPKRYGNNATTTFLSPCLPRKFATMPASSFVDLIVRFSSRLQKKFINEYIISFEREKKELRIAYQREDILREIVNQMPESVDFHEACSALEPRFSKPCTFAGRFASVYLGTMRVDNNFSVISRGKNEYWSSLMDLLLKGIMHCKQFKEIQAI